jgi:dipeptidyl-peptidase-4
VIQSVLLDGTRTSRVIRDGAEIATLPSVSERPPYMPVIELATARVGEREHHAAIVWPRARKAGERYPVIVDVYGGPHHKVVTMNPYTYLIDQWMADAGFAVVRIDGRGTPDRGRDWERVIKHDLVTIPMSDQADALAALAATRPELDLSRVGITGWSFGGYMSAMAVMLRPDVFHAAVSGAPVTDWRDYDTHYTERYMGLPDANAAGYATGDVNRQAEKLARPLLLVHGTTDDNVYFTHTLKLSQALFRAGKHFELLPLAGFTHMVPDPVVKTRLHGRIIEFLRGHLAAAPE